MDQPRPLAKAWERYQQRGATELVKGAINATEFSSIPGFNSMVSRSYSKLMVDSEELKRCYSSRWWELPEDLDGLYEDVNKDIAPLQNEAVTYNNSPQYLFKQPFVAEVPNVTLAGPYAVAITQDGGCILETLNSRTNSQHMRLGSAIKKSITNAPLVLGGALFRDQQPSTTESESVAAVLQSYWDSNYYHWVLEELLKLRGVARYEQETGANVKIIIPKDPPTFVTESLSMLGYGEADYIKWDETVRPLHIDRLIVPSFPELTPRTITWLRDEMRKRTDPVTDDSPDWVYVSRQNEPMRRVANYETVEKVLNRHNVYSVQCEEITLEEEIRLFSDVDGVIGPHGAGLTASIWGSDVHIVELFNEVVQPPYYILAHVLDFEYTALTGKPVGEADEARNNNFTLEKRQLEAVLEQAGV